jgi:hypothetical protein
MRTFLSRRDGSLMCRVNWRRPGIVAITVGVLLALVGCTATPVESVENPTVISYAGAASRLSGMEPADAEEQLRDWTQISLASHLELDAPRLRDALYDVMPVRDPAFTDLSRQSTGLGRALFDGRGVLHVLVPRGGPHESRTIGLLIDQYRADAGADPQQVQVHHYQIHPATQTIQLTPDKPAPTSEVRSAHGFVTMRVNETAELTDFLARARHLSWLEVRDSEIWAGGWNWPDVPAAPLDIEDVSVIQRGYLQSAGRHPGFSLDPGPVRTREDILAVVPGLRPEWADRLISRNWNGTPFRSAEGLAAVVGSALIHHDPAPAVLAQVGLPTDPSQLWALNSLLRDRPIYSQARNDGRLEGTKVGMTLFYADKVAKDWVAGVGTGVPTKAVGGFVPNSGADIPWSHCHGTEGPKLDEYGRLWFGQNDAGFNFADDRVSIGAQATRLFSRSEQNGGVEVEPSFSFGRGMRWWDQHYQDIADYEPQYQRLDQIMRWSGALEWLTTKTTMTLPQLDDATIRSDLRFQDWYAQHSELRERSSIEFVTPPSAQHEAIRTTPSEVYKSCGVLGIFGGVSLGDVLERKGNRSFQAANVPESLRRGALYDETSRFDEATGSGRINQQGIDGRGQVIDNLERRFSTTADGRNVVDVEATGREVAPLGGVKVWRAKVANRQYKLEMTVRPGLISQRVEYQHQELGALVTRSGVDSVTIQWQRGWLDRARRALEAIQSRQMSQPSTGLPLATEGVLSSYKDTSGQMLYKIGGPDAPWLSITNDVPPPGEEMALRVGVPDPRTGEAQFLLGRFVPRPELPPTDGGPPWMKVTPRSGEHPGPIVAAGFPERNARTVQVTNPDRSQHATVQTSEPGGTEWAQANDPIVGFHATPEGAALLRDFPRVEEAMHAAAQAKDGLLRGVSLDGDGVALAGADEVILVAAEHPWAARVLQAIGPGPSSPLVLFLKKGDRIYHADSTELTRNGPVQHMTGGEILARNNGDHFLHSVLAFEHGSPTPKHLAVEDKFLLVPFLLADHPNVVGRFQPDVRIHGGEQWWQMSGGGAAAGIGGPVLVTTGQVYLVCPDTNEHVPGCDKDQ